MTEPRPIKGGLVVLGIVLGIVATFVWFFIVFAFALSFENDPNSSPDWLVFLLFVLPLPASIALLAVRRTRQAAAGFVMGLAIGTLVLAGFCSSFLIPGLTA